jgi:hypothetical protein
MSIFTASSRSVKLHPSAPVNRPTHPFVEGLATAPAPVNRIAAFLPQAPAPISPEARLDAAWHSGYCLGADGIDAAPRKVWPLDVQAAFLGGLAWGHQQREADLEATAAMYAGMESVEMSSHFAHCYA